MGLDMYMKQRMYVSPFNFDVGQRARRITVNVTTEYENGCRDHKEFSTKDYPQSGVYVDIPIAYWRKANHIHKWFVDNCANGEDDCKPVYVSREKIKELLDTCKAVLDDHSKAKDLLPTTDGFFFGCTDYDEWYYLELENTIKMLSDLSDDGEIYYEASW